MLALCKHVWKRLLGLQIVFLLVLGLSRATLTSATPMLQEIAPGIWVGEIENGPEVLIAPSRTVPMFSSTVLVPAGSALENESISGAAHYLEHLLFNGTTTRTREDIYEEADLLGAYHNASTQRERTVFQLLLPSENWREGLALQADMLLNSTLPEAMFDKERGILLEEIAKDRSQPTYLANLAEFRALYGSDPRSLPVLGTYESVSSMALEKLRTFYRDHYSPSGLTLIVMGDFDTKDLWSELTKLYSRPTKPDTRATPAPAFPAKSEIVFERIEGLGKKRIRLFFPLPPFDAKTHARATLLQEILTSGSTSSLRGGLDRAKWVTTDGDTKSLPVLSAVVGVTAGASSSILTLSIDTAEDVPAHDTIQATLAHLATAAKKWILRSEVDDAKRAFLNDEVFLREKMHYYGLFRADVLGQGDLVASMRVLDESADVTAKEIRELLSEILSQERALVVVTGDVPARRVPLGKFPGADPEAAAPDTPTPAKPSSENSFRRADSLTIRRIAKPGQPTFVLQTSPEGGTCAIHVLLTNRREAETANSVPHGTADVLHRMLAKGPSTRRPEEWQAHLSRHGIQIKVTDSDFIPYDDYYYTAEFSYVRVEAIEASTGEAVSALRELLSNPRLDADTFVPSRASALARASQETSSARSAAREAFLTYLSPEHPERGGPLGDPRALEGLDLDTLRKFADDYLVADRALVAVSGTMHPDLLTELLISEPLLPHGDSDEAPKERREKVPSKEPGRTEIVTEVGQEQAQLIVGAALPPMDESEATALSVAVALLSARLADELREREGLAYSIGATARVTGQGPYVRMSGGTRPENLERMEEGMRGVAQSLREAPPTEREIRSVLNQYEGRRRMRRLSRIGQAYALVMAEFRGHDPGQINESARALSDVTPAQVQEAAQKFLSFEPSIVSVAR